MSGSTSSGLPAQRISQSLAALVLLLGVAVMAAWLLRIDAWLQLNPRLPTVKFNTALGFALAALGLLLAPTAARRAGLAAALAGGALAALTLAQHLFAIDLGIDQWLVRDYLSDSPLGGRQAPISSLYFILFALAMVASSRRAGGFAQGTAAILGSILLALGGASAIGYLMDARPLLGWEGGLAVAPLTAVGQCLLALALILTLRARRQRESEPLLPPLAEYALAVTLLLGLLVWRGLVSQEQQRQSALQQAEAVWLARRVEDQLRAPLRPLARMALRWQVESGTPESVWRPDAAALVNDVEGVISMQWLDASGMVRWIEPEAPARHLLGTRPNRDPARIALLQAARQSGKVAISDPIQLLQGGLGLLLFAPLQVDERADGFLVAVVKLEQRLDAILGESTSAWRRRIEFSGETIYQDPDFDARRLDDWQLTRTPLFKDDPRWTLLTRPGPGAESRSRQPEVVLASVVLLAAMLQAALLLGAGNARRARELEQANQALAAHRREQEDLLQQLVRTNERFRLAADSARIGVWDWDLATRQVHWDEWMYRLFDLDPAHSDPYRDGPARLHPDDRPRLAEALDATVRGGQPLHIELRVVRDDGSLGDLLCHGLALDVVEGRARRLLGVMLDISERKRLERLQNEFVATVSHELRTPLTSINGALSLVVGGALGSLPEPALKLLEVARSNSARLTTLINDLLDMEKLLAGGVQLELSRQPLAPLVEQVVEANRSYAEPLGVRYRIEGGPDCQLRVDPLRLQQVLANLLSNAAKFSPAGSAVDLRWQRREGWIRVEVIDRGRGIAAEFRDRVFQKFSQADGSDTRRRGGTGLGLAISRELIERMGGQIGFDSEPGRGSTFWFELPDASEEPASG